jgi:hypothetical protein
VATTASAMNGSSRSTVSATPGISVGITTAACSHSSIPPKACPSPPASVATVAGDPAESVAGAGV